MYNYPLVQKSLKYQGIKSKENWGMKISITHFSPLTSYKRLPLSNDIKQPSKKMFPPTDVLLKISLESSSNLQFRNSRDLGYFTLIF